VGTFAVETGVDYAAECPETAQVQADITAGAWTTLQTALLELENYAADSTAGT
jgi:hypothetical protein